MCCHRSTSPSSRSSQVIASCVVEPQLRHIRSRSTLDPPPASNTFDTARCCLQLVGPQTPSTTSSPRPTFLSPIPAYERLNKKFTPTYHFIAAVFCPTPASESLLPCAHPTTQQQIAPILKCPVLLRVYTGLVFTESCHHRSQTSSMHEEKLITSTNS